MEEYELYINVKKPAIGLYVRKGASLPDFADPKDWAFDGTSAQDLLPLASWKALQLIAMPSETWIDACRSLRNSTPLRRRELSRR